MVLAHSPDTPTPHPRCAPSPTPNRSTRDAASLHRPSRRRPALFVALAAAANVARRRGSRLALSLARRGSSLALVLARRSSVGFPAETARPTESAAISPPDSAVTRPGPPPPLPWISTSIVPSAASPRRIEFHRGASTSAHRISLPF